MSMNAIERILLNLPCLKYVGLNLKGLDDLCDGYRWQILSHHFITFTFTFNVQLSSIAQVLASFRTSFWLEEKRWVVTYKNNCLYSYIPSSSTVWNMRKKSDPVHELNKTEYLSVHSSADLLKYNPLEYNLPHLRKLSIFLNTTDMIRELQGYQFKQILKLYIVIRIPYDEYLIKKLSHLFPCIEDLSLFGYENCSIYPMILIVDNFKHLQNFSVQSGQSPSTEKFIYDNQKLVARMTNRLTDDTFTCRILDSPGSSVFNDVHWWIGAQVSVDYRKTYYLTIFFIAAIALTIILDNFLSTTNKMSLVSINIHYFTA